MTNIPPLMGHACADRQTIRVCAPIAHAGIGDALRRAFAAPPLNSTVEELLRKIDRS